MNSRESSGSYTININNKRRLNADYGERLLAVLLDNGIAIPSVCGGRGVCGTCKCRVTKGAGEMSSVETSLLSAEQIVDGVRLACQVRVCGDLEIELPDGLLDVRDHESICTEIEELTYDTRRFRFELKDPPTMDFVPGQFVQLLCPKYGGRNEEVCRAYSIASDPARPNLIDLIIRRVPNGICTTWCFDFLKIGDPVTLSGPYGDFCLSETDAPIVFVAGGSGMAPFVSILSHMRNIGSKRQAKYFFGGNTTGDLCMAGVMKAFEDALEGFEFVPVVTNPEEDSGWTGQVGLVTEAVCRTYSDLSGHEGYLCGSPGMINAAVKVFTDLGMPGGKIYYDKFA
ncbi:MAG: FAD-binding oxidoreductase [Planctomycetota bacterium]